MRDIITGQDADFSEARLISRYNADLANDLGNLVNRTINMAQRYRSGTLRKAKVADPDLERLETIAQSMIEKYRLAFEQFQPHAALEAVWELVAAANALVEKKAPWKLAKDPAASDLLDSVLYTLAESARLLAQCMSPIIPGASTSILRQLNATIETGFKWDVLADGHRVGTPSPVFPRLG
jgi:methionyl-tRNA synthetase